MPTITRWNSLYDTENGREENVHWPALFERFSHRVAYRGDAEHPGWSAARFTNATRALANVRAVSALCLDFDKGETIDAVAGRLDGLSGFVHTTRKHTLEAPRFRVILPFARVVSPFEYEALWRRIAHVAGSVDQAPKDPSRFWYEPGVVGDGPFEARWLAGSQLDPDEWLARPDPTYVPPRHEAPALSDPNALERRAIAYIARMPSAISGQGGHDATWAVALTLTRGFGLSERRTFEILRSEYNPRCEPPWSDSELQHKAKQASEKGRAEAGYLADAQRPLPDEKGSSWKPEAPPPREPGDDSVEIAAEQAKPKGAVERYGVASMRSMYLEVLERASSGKPEEGFTTGFAQVDAAIGGLRRGHVTLLAAQTSWGKSSAGVLVCLKNCGTAARPLVVSTEDKRLMYAKRMVASDCKINAIALRDNRLKLEDLRRLTRAAQDVPDEPIFLDAVGPGKNVEWVAKAIAELSKECGTSLVILDYIQRFKTDRFGSDKRNQVTYMGETLGDAIKTSNCAGLALSQLRRTNGKEPSMDDVKESGDLENMAEHVMIGWRKVEGEDRDENGAAKRMLNIPKNKDGPVFFNWLELEFDVTTASFTGQLADHRPDNIKQFDDFGDAQNWSDP